MTSWRRSTNESRAESNRALNFSSFSLKSSDAKHSFLQNFAHLSLFSFWSQNSKNGSEKELLFRFLLLGLPLKLDLLSCDTDHIVCSSPDNSRPKNSEHLPNLSTFLIIDEGHNDHQADDTALQHNIPVDKCGWVTAEEDLKKTNLLGIRKICGDEEQNDGCNTVPSSQRCIGFSTIWSYQFPYNFPVLPKFQRPFADQRSYSSLSLGKPMNSKAAGPMQTVWNQQALSPQVFSSTSPLFLGTLCSTNSVSVETSNFPEHLLFAFVFFSLLSCFDWTDHRRHGNDQLISLAWQEPSNWGTSAASVHNSRMFSKRSAGFDFRTIRNCFSFRKRQQKESTDSVWITLRKRIENEKKTCAQNVFETH